MKSPLSLEEKVQVNRLLRHDFATQLAILGNIALVQDGGSRRHEAIALMYHADSILEAFNALTLDEVFLGAAEKCSLEYFAEALKYSLHEKAAALQVNVGSISKFNTSTSLVYSVIYNLVKNSYAAHASQVHVGIAPFSGVPDLVFIPDGASSVGNFVRISVTDNGPGFPSDRPLASYLDIGVSSRKGGGFGLYFVKLASKFLRAGIGISSEKGNTSVSLYHPLDL